MLKLGHWKVNAEIDSKSVPPNVHLSHKKAKPVVWLAKFKNGCPIMGLSIRQWSHDSPPCICLCVIYFPILDSMSGY